MGMMGERSSRPSISAKSPVVVPSAQRSMRASDSAVRRSGNSPDTRASFMRCRHR